MHHCLHCIYIHLIEGTLHRSNKDIHMMTQIIGMPTMAKTKKGKQEEERLPYKT